MGVLLENIFFFFERLGSECVCFVFVFGGSVNEWMRRKGEDGRGGEGGFM